MLSSTNTPSSVESPQQAPSPKRKRLSETGSNNQNQQQQQQPPNMMSAPSTPTGSKKRKRLSSCVSVTSVTSSDSDWTISSISSTATPAENGSSNTPTRRFQRLAKNPKAGPVDTTMHERTKQMLDNPKEWQQKIKIDFCEGKGLGVFAKVPIRKFDFVLEVIGEFVSPEEGERREERAKRTNKDMAFLMYQIQADNGEDICLDPFSVKDKDQRTFATFGQKLNHSHSKRNLFPRLVWYNQKRRYFMVASKNIKPGEQVFIDYGEMPSKEHKWLDKNVELQNMLYNEEHWKAKHEEVAKSAKVIDVKEEEMDEDNEILIEGTPEQAEKVLKLLMASQKTCEALKKENVKLKSRNAAMQLQLKQHSKDKQKSMEDLKNENSRLMSALDLSKGALKSATMENTMLRQQMLNTQFPLKNITNTETQETKQTFTAGRTEHSALIQEIEKLKSELRRRDALLTNISFELKSWTENKDLEKEKDLTVE